MMFWFRLFAEIFFLCSGYVFSGAKAINVTVVEGRTAVLPCIASKSATEVLWYGKNYTILTIDQRRVIDDDRISVERPYQREYNLMIRDVRYTDSGKYVCRIKSESIIEERIVYLDVLSVVDNVTVMEGRSVVLPCRIPGEGRDRAVVWMAKRLLTYNDRRLIDDYRISVERPYRWDWNLMIRNVRYTDRGMYVCKVDIESIRPRRVFLNVIVMAVILNLLETRRRHHIERTFRDRQNPLDYMLDGTVIKTYRLDRATIYEICALLNSELERPTRRSRSLSVSLQVLTAWRFFATGAFQSVIGDGHYINKM